MDKKKFEGAPEDPIVSQTVRGYINDGNALLEITRTAVGYTAAIADTTSYGAYVDTVDGLYKERFVWQKISFFEKPSAKQIHGWLQGHRWFLFDIVAGTVEALLAALP